MYEFKLIVSFVELLLAILILWSTSKSKDEIRIGGYITSGIIFCGILAIWG